MGSLKGFERLTSNKQFQSVYNRGVRKHTRSFVLFYQRKEGQAVGFTASKKVGNAVKRNSAKRRLRALFIEVSQYLNDGVYIFVAKESINQFAFDVVKKDVLYALRSLKLNQKKPKKC